MDDSIRGDALDLTRRAKFVYVSTIDATGYPETRVMFNLLKHRAKALSEGPGKVPREFACYVGTNTSSKKVGQMRAEPRACLYYSDNGKYQGCMIRGRVSEVGDPEIRKAIWTPAWDMYYPGGLDGGDFSLFLFVPETVRYYHGLAVHEFGA